MGLAKSSVFLPALLFAFILLAWVPAPARAQTALGLVPAPQSLSVDPGAFALSSRTPVFAVDPGARAAAQRFVDLVARTRGLRLTLSDGAPTDNSIVFTRDDSIVGAEAYKLRVYIGGATVSASTDAGMFYGATTLWQLATLNPGRGAVAVPAVEISDAPRFAWRGLMLDSSRHFQSVAFVKRFIDLMATEKFNVLHWHLTDDQGWRLEIRKYPRLTEIGAWRRSAGAAGATETHVGGFYTQAEVRDVVAYATARHIMIVPEIEMPGHATAAIVAYPQFGAALTPPTAVGADWGIYPNLYNTDDATFVFLEDVLTEVMELFPSPFIHVGGDEAVKPQWVANPGVQARMHAAGIANEQVLQSWFTTRIDHFLSAHGRRLIGWDEILEGGIAPNAAVMSWRGTDGAIAAARAGHDTVLSPAPTVYFDNLQSRSPSEPPGRAYLLTVKDVYAYDPAPAQLNDAERAHILGVQANLWAEHMRSEARVEAKAFPRAAAIAEMGWSPEDARTWNDFAPRLVTELSRYDALGVGYERTAIDVTAVGSPTGAGGTVTLATPLGLGDIRYTTNGTAPTARSAIYGTPLAVHAPTRVRAQAFVGDRALGVAQSWWFDAAALATRTSQQLRPCEDKLGLNLEDDAPLMPGGAQRAVFMIDVMAPCWIYEGAELSGVSTLTASVGSVPFNFQIGDAVNEIKFRAPATAAGELEARLDTCDGPRIASIPLATAATRPGVTTLSGPITPQQGRHDICFTFTQRGVDPMYAIDWVRVAPSRQH